jgi:hypothetical protein
MHAVIHSPCYLASVLALFSVGALMKWKVRRAFAARRVNRGLRVYASNQPVVS